MLKMLGSSKVYDLPAIITDPFKEDKITCIGLYWRSAGWWGYVEFKNGKTEGKQGLVESDSLDNMVAQIRAIVESIKDKP